MIKIQFLTTFLSRLSKREKLVFYCAVGFVALTMLDRVIISPISDKIKSLDKEIYDMESAIKKNLRILAHRERILAAKKKYSSYLISSKSDEEEMTSILKAIETLADKASIYLVDMKPGEIKDMGSSKKFSVNLNCSGSSRTQAFIMLGTSRVLPFRDSDMALLLYF